MQRAKRILSSFLISPVSCRVVMFVLSNKERELVALLFVMFSMANVYILVC